MRVPLSLLISPFLCLSDGVLVSGVGRREGDRGNSNNECRIVVIDRLPTDQTGLDSTGLLPALASEIGLSLFLRRLKLTCDYLPIGKNGVNFPHRYVPPPLSFFS